jgi:uncharacterized PurR-regulated membrane protein YhhQ (DUF165 family)
MKFISALLYLMSIICANLLVSYYGIISFAGFVFPAGALMIGFCFTFRDIVQKYYGKYLCWLWMLLATIITIFFSKDIAIASGLAFMIAETMDWVIFTFVSTSFRKRIILSNVVSLPLDSLIFVPMVFGWLWEPIIGQAIVKIFFSLIIIPTLKKA